MIIIKLCNTRDRSTKQIWSDKWNHSLDNQIQRECGESMETPDLLRKHGFEFIYEWQFDDLPCWMRTEYGPMIALPYALELNDVIAFSMHKQTADEWFQRFKYAIETFEAELPDQPRVITLALHPHVLAVPMRRLGECAKRQASTKNRSKTL